MKYVGQLGPALGVALIGAVVNSSLHLSLAVALQRGFWVVFVLSGATLLMAFFLRDVPMATSTPTNVTDRTAVCEQEMPAYRRSENEWGQD